MQANVIILDPSEMGVQGIGASAKCDWRVGGIGICVVGLGTGSWGDHGGSRMEDAESERWRQEVTARQLDGMFVRYTQPDFCKWERGRDGFSILCMTRTYYPARLYVEEPLLILQFISPGSSAFVNIS
jgi:hypothetical protein